MSKIPKPIQRNYDQIREKDSTMDEKDSIIPLTQNLSKLSTNHNTDFAIPKKQQRQRSKSVSFTPVQRLVKPSPAAFHSTGLLSKKNRLPNHSFTPVTPIKNKFNLSLDQSPMIHFNLNTPSTPIHSNQKIQNQSVNQSSNQFDFQSPIVNPFQKNHKMVPPSTTKSKLINRSPMKDSPVKSNKRMHLLPDSSPLSKLDCNNIDMDEMEPPKTNFFKDLSKDTPIKSLKHHSDSPESITHSPSQSTTFKSKLFDLSSDTMFDEFLSTKKPHKIQSFSSRIAKEKIDLPSNQNYTVKHTNSNHIPFSNLISRYRHVIDESFFRAINGEQPFLQQTLSIFSSRVHQDAQSPIPDHFETRFEILSRLGHGAFADAFHVLSLDDAREYAIKKTRQPFLGYKDAIQKLEEVRMLLKVKGCIGCITIHSAWIQFGYLYIQMEICSRGTLERYLEEYCSQAPLSETQIWRILSEMVQGLHGIHKHGIVHLDIKPANILISDNGTLKIGDFGLAAQVPMNPGSEHEGDRTYLAPELLKNSDSISYSADIFSMGLIILEITANIILPENGPIWHELRENNFTSVSFGPNSQTLIDIIKSMLNPDPKMRPSAEDLMMHPLLNQIL